MTIQVLSSEIINQIAAGEVVERPAHLVKELVENSIDAESDQIVIEVSDGGRSIRVSDNGSGIYSEELGKALERHATSKITKTDDLWNLHTFGFRGEALASAAAVSKMTLKSHQRTEKKPMQIESSFGKISVAKPSSQSVGTEIKIDDLFENVPARLKFLKSESSEIGQIKSVVKALALAHPEIEFKLIASGQLQLFYGRKKTRLERVQDVLEKKSLYEVNGQLGSFKSHIVFSSPHDVAKTSKQIWIFAQNRWVQDRALQAAVTEAYRSLLMHGEWPFAVVWLDCAPQDIDVNIHPTKSQVKFQDASAAFRVVQGTLRGALERAPWLSGTGMVAPQSQAFIKDISSTASTVENMKFEDQSFQHTQFKSKDYNPSASAVQPTYRESLNWKNNQHVTHSTRDYQMLSVDTVSGSYWSSLQVIGQAHLTYIVCQKNDRLVFVDQHAAHERVVYESLMKSWNDKKFEVQSYLFPLAIDLSEDKIEALLKVEPDINSMGFELERLGPESLGIKAAPSLIKDSSLPVVFEKMATDLLQNGGSFAIEKKISDLFATMACHSVIRAGQSLSVPEMQELLKSMDQFSLSSFCPHGRPVSVEKTFTELEKQFGRIV